MALRGAVARLRVLAHPRAFPARAAPPLLASAALRPPPPTHAHHRHGRTASTSAAASAAGAAGATAAPAPRATVREFTVPSFAPERGGLLDVTLVYATYGDPTAPCILHPTSFDARHEDLEYAIGPGRALDTDKFFVVVPNMLGNGLSSSPSSSALRGRFPLITVADNIRLQHHLLTEHLGISSLALCYGYSMGAMQALAWAATHPGFVQRVLASCGTASCHPYNAVFLEGLLAVLEADAAFAANGGFFDAPPTAALRAFGRVYAGWGLPAEWYRRDLWLSHGYASLDDFLTRSWCGWTCAADANNLRCQLRTWRDAVVEPAALGRITARVVYMPGAGDRYFPLEEAVAEAALVGRGEARLGESSTGSSGGSAAVPAALVVPLSAEWGHRAGDPYRPGQEADRALIARTVAELLAAPPGGSA